MTLSLNPHDSLPVFRGTAGDVLATANVDPVSGGFTGAAQSVNEYYYSGVKYPLQSVILNVASDPDEILAAAATDKAYYVVRAFITNKGAGNIDFTLEDDTAAITHVITAGANGGGGNSTLGVLCTAEEALNVAISSGTATDLGMTVFYITIDV